MRTRLALTFASFLCAACAVAAPAPGSDEKPKDTGKTEPAGLPLEITIVANKDTYPLDLGGKTDDDFKKMLNDGGSSASDAPKVDLTLVIRNTSDKEVQIQFGGTKNLLTLDLQGPGAVQGDFSKRPMPLFLLAPKTATVAPGKTLEVPIKSLAYGKRNLTNAAFWTAAGDYTIKATYQIGVSPAPKDTQDVGNGFGTVTVTSAPVKVKVEAK
jgi:hypothetical protein